MRKALEEDVEKLRQMRFVEKPTMVAIEVEPVVPCGSRG